MVPNAILTPTTTNGTTERDGVYTAAKRLLPMQPAFFMRRL